MVAKIGYLRTVESLSRMALGVGEHTEPFVQGGVRLCRAVANDKRNHRLLRIMAEESCDRLEQDYKQEYVFYDDYESPQDETDYYALEREARQLQEQQELRMRYPDVPEWMTLAKIARDGCLAYDGVYVDSVYLDNGGHYSLSQPTSNGEVLSDDAAMLSVLYGSLVRPEIEDELGVSMAELTFAEQKNLLRYMSWSDDKTYKKLCKSIKTSKAPEGLARAFLATEFGDDHGDSILAIAEHATPEQSQEIFETINNFRESSKKIAAWYESYDPELAKDIELAMNERLSDALAAMEVLARDGRLEVDTSPGRHAEDYESDGRFVMKLHSVERGIEILNALGKSLHLIHDIVVADDVVVHRATEENGQFVVYRFSSDQLGDVLLRVRPEGAKGYDRQLEYGTRSGVEASISFIVNPSAEHDLDIYKDPHGMSLRFEREGRTVDESPFSQERDPTREDGLMSLDISALVGNGQHMPEKIGRFIAAGNILRAAKTGGGESLHHNNNHFNQATYGTAGGFARLAVYTAHMAEAMIAFQRQGSHASGYQSIPANKTTVV